VNCPYCGGQEARVIDSRSLDEVVRRRRKCLTCGARFTTYERIQPHEVFVIKKDGRREEFSRDKLSLGIRKACEKRPLPIGAVDKLMDNIEAELYKAGKSEVASSYIGLGGTKRANLPGIGTTQLPPSSSKAVDSLIDCKRR